MEVQSVEAFLDYYGKIRARTLRVVECIPPDKIEWTYREGKWTLGDLVRHLGALERWMFAENVQGRESRYAGCGRDVADGYEEVLAYFHRTHQETLEILRTLSDEDLKAPCVTPGGAKIRTGKWLRAMVEHEVHHRGQIYLYLGLLGVETPPLYGLSAEQVQERSV